MEQYIDFKKEEILLIETTWMSLEEITVSEIDHTQKDKYCMISLKCVLENSQIYKSSEQTGGCQGLGAMG